MAEVAEVEMALNHFVLKSISFIFTKNKVEIPSAISNTMRNLNCEVDESFAPSFGTALTHLINWQELPRANLHKQVMQTCYHCNVMRRFDARDFLEYLAYNIQSSLLDIKANKHGVVRKYNIITQLLKRVKDRNLITADFFSELEEAAEEIQEESIERLKSIECKSLLGTKRSRPSEGNVGAVSDEEHTPLKRSNLAELEIKNKYPEDTSSDDENVSTTDSTVYKQNKFYWAIRSMRGEVSVLNERMQKIVIKYNDILEGFENRKQHSDASKAKFDEIKNELKKLEDTREEIVRNLAESND